MLSTPVSGIIEGSNPAIPKDVLDGMLSDIVLNVFCKLAHFVTLHMT